jgi:4-hydroxybenzoyl-CoA reductase subunit alpha
VTGAAKFTADLTLPEMLHGKILRSPYPHARILQVDAVRACRLAGVRAVVTGKDTLGIKYGTMDPFMDELGLAVDKVRYIGDDVAAVAAVDEDTALEALDLIQVDYEPLPAVFTPEEAMQPGAPRIHDHAENNVSARIRIPAGDVEKGIRESDYVFEDTFSSGWVTHCNLEPHAALAAADLSGRLTIWCNTQVPFRFRTDLARLLGLPLGKVRVIKPFMGGGFGARWEILGVDFCAAFLAQKIGRPVKIVYDRQEVFSASRRKVPMTVYLKTGVRRDGALVAKHCRVIADGGAYNGLGPQIIATGATQLTNLYRFEHLLYEALHVYTNNPVTSPMRGFGNNAVRFADDSQLDRIARELNLEPVEIRLKNARQQGDVTILGATIKSCGLNECIQVLAEKTGFHAKRGRLDPGRGIGMGAGVYVSGAKIWLPHDSSSAFVKVNEDGSVSLLTGTADIGQGSTTVLAQLAAHELGISPQEITVIAADTDSTPYDLGTYASRVTFIAGNAVLAAARDAKRQLLEVAAEKLEADPEDLQFRDHKIEVKGVPEKKIGFHEAVQAALFSKKGMPIMGRGYYNPPTDYDPQVRRGSRTAAYAFGAQVAEGGGESGDRARQGPLPHGG